MDFIGLRAFLALADAGTLHAAAEVSGTPRSTLSRRVQALEALVGAPLFDRRGNRAGLSPAGRLLQIRGRELVRALDGAIQDAARPRTQSEVVVLVEPRLCGLLGAEVLAPLQHRWPDATLCFRVVADAEARLHLGEGGAALHLEGNGAGNRGLPVNRHDVAEQRIGLFATADYLQRQGVPGTVEALRGHVLIVTTGDEDWHGVGSSAPAIWRAGSDLITTRLVAGGLGVGLLAESLALGLQRILPEVVEEGRRAVLSMREGTGAASA